ncbi:glycosyltransferase family 39 protein [Sphingomonas sp. dw_22]|uniref:glycosyltransferase family 39 protein n=1 Tax=Sphingomonas sp. dw_22 TaxID=2721175 RepID=UPI001BD5B0CC|nr:glycosyltransferase family 39 protein [Sphingomonas sp. dw_22]
MTAAPLRRGEALLLAGVVLAAAALRIATADYGLWFDEIASLAFAHQPLDHLWGDWMVRETNPPLYYTLLKGWIGFAGDADRSVRLLSIAFGLAGIGAGALLARRLGGPAAGVFAAALLALSASHVDLSQEVRGYGMAQSAVLIAILGATCYLEQRRLRDLLLYGIAATIALYAHTTLVLFVFLANLTMLWLLRRDRAAVVRWVCANAAVGLAWAWWASITLRQLAGDHRNIAWIVRADFLGAWHLTGNVYAFAVMPDGGVRTGIALAALLGAILWLVWRDRRPAVAMLAVFALGAPVLLFVISQWVPIFLPRTLSWAAGPATVLLAVAVASIPARPVAAVLAGLLLLLEAVTLTRWLPIREEEGWREAIEAVARTGRAPVLLVQGDATAFAAAHYRARDSSMPIVVLARDSGDGDRWADGMVPGLPHVDGSGARALLRGGRDLFTLRRADSDPAPQLAGVAAGTSIPVAGDRQPFVTRWRLR